MIEMTRTHYCQGVEVPWPLDLARQSTRQETKDRKMPGFRGELGEGEAGTQRRGVTRYGLTPQGVTGNWVQAKSSKEGSAPSREMAADAVMRHRAQVQAAEAGGCQVRSTSRWSAL